MGETLKEEKKGGEGVFRRLSPFSLKVSKNCCCVARRLNRWLEIVFLNPGDRMSSLSARVG